MDDEASRVFEMRVRPGAPAAQHRAELLRAQLDEPISGLSDDAQTQLLQLVTEFLA